MTRRDVELFNLSFLDILAGALGAVLFLFIVVPKGGGQSPPASPQLSVTFDTIQNKFFGELPDSMLQYQIGDSLLSLVINYDVMPSIKNCPEPRPCPKCPDTKSLDRKIALLQKTVDNQPKPTKVQPIANVQPTKKVEETSTPKKLTSTPVASKYKGDMPSVPCKFSVEVAWDNIDNNVDLYLCKDGSCVYGGKRKRTEIGFWDSGKSKTSFFGGDLRSTQEAVRQFDSVIEGEYEIYAQYKDAKEAPEASVTIRALIYTNTIENGEKGETFNVDLPFDKNERTLLGTLNVSADGNFSFDKRV